MIIARFCGQIVLIGCVKCGQRGGGGVENPENFADVLYVWSLRKQTCFESKKKVQNLSLYLHVLTSPHPVVGLHVHGGKLPLLSTFN